MKTIENRKLKIKKLVDDLLTDSLSAEDIPKCWSLGLVISLIEERLVHEIKHYVEDG